MSFLHGCLFGPPRFSRNLSDCRENALLCWYAVTLFLSAFLVFLVQPMVGKMILPLYGGTPATWNICMLFFQTALLAGYLYAHAATKWLGVRRQAVVHLLLFPAPLLLLPIVIAADSAPPWDVNPVAFLLAKLLVSVGLPFFLISSSAPLLQKWFAGTSHPSAKDPYFLYAASNCGSLLALLAYPLFVEPGFALHRQSLIWTGGYILLIIMIVVCAIFLWRSSPGKIDINSHSDEPREKRTNNLCRPGLRDRFYWVFAAFVPSSLMLGVTAFITTNVAAVPLLWVLPLALYLLTFVIVFSRKEWLPHRLLVRIMPATVVLLSVFIFMKIRGADWALIPVHLFLFFITAMVCHGQLVRRRPETRYLTEFYLWMSIGGVLGGVFNAIIAPLFFTRVVEYPFVLVLACFLIPRTIAKPDDPLNQKLNFLLPLAVAGLSAIILTLFKTTNLQNDLARFAVLFAPLALICLSFKNRPVRFALSFAIVLVSIGIFADLKTGSTLFSTRNFFGVKRILMDEQGDIRKLAHGTTLHGAQFIDAPRRRIPLTYYHHTGPIGDVFSTINPKG